MLKLLFISLILTLTSYAKDTKPTLTIYTYDAFSASWGAGPKIKEAFEKEQQCNVKFVPVSSSIGALRKIQLEGKKTKADILMGLDTSIAQMAKETKLFTKHGIDTSKLHLPLAYTDDFFLPFDYSYFAFVYDSNKLKNPPSSFEALAQMPKDFKIVIQDPRSSTAGLGLLLWIKDIYQTESYSYWKTLSPHILTITKGWSEAYGLFLKGEADMVLSFTTSPAYHRIDENKSNYKAAQFEEGHYTQIEVAGILKSSKQQKLAKAFLAFTQSQTFAKIIPTGNWAYPVVKSKEALPKAFESLIQPKKILLIQGETVQKNRKEYVDEWLRALKD
jgi:thiamine transport system substrate-binding protein